MLRDQGEETATQVKKELSMKWQEKNKQKKQKPQEGMLTKEC